MQINIISVTHKLPHWVVNVCAEYLKRLNTGQCCCKFIDIKADAHRSGHALDNMLKESKKIISHIPQGSLIIILDEHGSKCSSVEFAKKLQQLTSTNSHITFIIGGADGIHPTVKKLAHMSLQLSSLTLPHALVRVVLIEQLYRAMAILNNHPYHRE